MEYVMKTFYTERDVEDMHAQGVTEIEVDDDVVLTDLAREKATELGMGLVDSKSGSNAERMLKAFGANLSAPAKSPPQPAQTSSDAESGQKNSELVQQVKARVIARLGTTEYNGILDQIIPQVLARLANTPKSVTDWQSSPAKNSDY